MNISFLHARVIQIKISGSDYNIFFQNKHSLEGELRLLERPDGITLEKRNF